MAFVSRLVNLFERMMTSSKEFEGEEEPGLWMTAGDAPQAVGSAATDTFSAPPAILPDVRPDAPQASQSAGPFIDAGTPPPELEERMPSIRIAAAAAEAAIPESTVGPGPEPADEGVPAAEQPAIPEGALHTLPASEESGSPDDMLSMFRSGAVNTPSSSLAKDIEEVTALELLAEAIVLRDLLVGAAAPTE